MFLNLINPTFSLQIGQCQHLKILRKPYWLNNDNKDKKDNKSVHFNIIHINPWAGLKCVNDPGNPSTFLSNALPPWLPFSPLL